MTVYLLWHVGHQNTAGAGGETRHGEEGTVFIDEQDGDDVKLLGVYSTRERAEERLARARSAPGFPDEPGCFVIDEYALDADAWRDGFGRPSAVGDVDG